MAETSWYFAVEDEERGPVTEAQLRALIATKNLSRDDLVWREGLEDWVRAGDVPGLFDKDRPADSAGAVPVDRRTPLTPAQPGRGSDTGAAGLAPAASEVRLPPASLLGRSSWSLYHHATLLGHPLLLAGLLLVLLSRGCDSVATHYAERVQAKSQLTQSRFKDEWDAKRAEIHKQQQRVKARVPQTDAERKILENLSKELDKLDEDKQREQAELTDGSWKALANAARDAEANNQMWGFWRTCVFWFGAVALSTGLVIVGFTSQGADRWMCLAMLAIVVYGLLTGSTH